MDKIKYFGTSMLLSIVLMFMLVYLHDKWAYQVSGFIVLTLAFTRSFCAYCDDYKFDWLLMVNSLVGMCFGLLFYFSYTVM